MRQAVRGGVVDELITIESREPVGSAEPEIAARVGNDLVNAIAGQAIGSGVGSDRKLFGGAARRRNENQYGDGKRSLHGAYDTTLRSLRLSAFSALKFTLNAENAEGRKGPQRNSTKLSG